MITFAADSVPDDFTNTSDDEIFHRRGTKQVELTMGIVREHDYDVYKMTSPE